MASIPIKPRRLTNRESAVVATLLSAGSAGAERYIWQIPHARVTATWGVGSPSVDLTVTAEPGRATEGVTDGIFANGAVTDSDGSPIGEVILWVENGRLSGIEYAWYTEGRPEELPEPSAITVL